LPLLVARIGRADDSHDAVAADYLAVAADLLHRSQYFHLNLAWERSSQLAPRRRSHRRIWCLESL